MKYLKKVAHSPSHFFFNFPFNNNMAARLLLSHFSRYFFFFLAGSILFLSIFLLFPLSTQLLWTFLPSCLFCSILSPYLPLFLHHPLSSHLPTSIPRSLSFTLPSSLFSSPSTLAFLLAEALILSVKHHLPLFTLFFLFPCSSTSTSDFSYCIHQLFPV